MGINGALWMWILSFVHLFQPSVAFHIETSQLFYKVKHT